MVRLCLTLCGNTRGSVGYHPACGFSFLCSSPKGESVFCLADSFEKCNFLNHTDVLHCGDEKKSFVWGFEMGCFK